MDEHAEQLADGPAPGPRANRGQFRPGDGRINRGGRPRKPPPGVHPADCAQQADRVMRLALPASELAWRLTRPNGFWLTDLPADARIVAARVDAAGGQVVFTVRSGTFRPVAKGAPIPEFLPDFNGLMHRRDQTWRPHDRRPVG